ILNVHEPAPASSRQSRSASYSLVCLLHFFAHSYAHPRHRHWVLNKKTETVTFREYDFDDGLVLMTGKLGPTARRLLDAMKSQSSCCNNEKVKAPDGSGSSGADSLFNRTLLGGIK